MNHFQSVPDWSTQASQAMHGMLFPRGGKQELPLHVGQWLHLAKSGSASCVCQWTNLVEIRKASKKATIVFMAVLESLVDQSKVF